VTSIVIGWVRRQSTFCFSLIGVLAFQPVLQPAWAGNNLWTGAGPDGGEVQDIALHPVDRDIAYAATVQNGLFKTTDGGQNWFAVTDGITTLSGNPPSIRQVAIDPQSPGTVYAAGSGEIHKSTDGGSSWNTFFFSGVEERSLVIDPSDPRNLYLAASNGIERSIDGGENWTAVNNGLTFSRVYDIAIDANLGNVLYAATDDGFFKSVDSGDNWQLLLDNIDVFGSPRALVVDPTSPIPGTVYGLTSSDVYKSTDGGATWVRTSPGLTSNRLDDLAIDPQNPMVLYAIGDGEIWKTVNGAASWDPSGSGHIPTSISYEIAVSPSDPERVLSASPGGVYASEDGGASWSDRSNGLRNTLAQDIVVDSGDAQILYAATGSGFYKTLDGGLSWVRGNEGLTWTSTTSITRDSDGDLYLGTFADGAFLSTDGGQSWSLIEELQPLARNVNDIATVPGNADKLFAGGGTSEGVSVSVDGGDSWTRITNGLPANFVLDIEIDPLTPSNMFVAQAASGDVLFRSTDGGASWVPSQSGITASTVTDIAFDPTSPSTVYAATNDGVFASSDGGVNWAAINNGLPPGVLVYSVIVNPVSTDRIYAGTNDGPFISMDAGGTWQRVEDEVTSVGRIAVRVLAVSALDADTLHAGTGRVGVKSYTFAGPGITVLPQALDLSEPDDAGTFIVRLDTEPSGPVAINLSATSTECGIDQDVVSLNASNRFETITVTVADDVLVDGPQACNIQIEPATSSDLVYDGIDPTDVSISVADDDTAGILVAPTSLSVSEPSGSADFTVSLQTPPLDAVSVALSTSNDECSVSPDTIALTGATPEAVVTVQALDDILLDGDQDCVVLTAPSTSSDPAYAGLDAADVTVTVEDTDVPGITVAPSSIDVDEGASNSFVIALDTVASASVDIALATTTSACSLTGSSVTLTPGDVTASVSVLGIDDLQFAGDRVCEVTLASSQSDDPNYDGVDPDDVAVAVLEATIAGVAASPTSGLVTDEDGGSDTFQVALTAIPTAEVIIALSSSDSGEGIPSAGAVTFTPGNALDPQTIAVTGQPDGAIDPDADYRIIIGPATSADANFDDLAEESVSVTNRDVDDFVFTDGFEQSDA